MDVSQERLNDLVAAPSESLNVELKRWIDPFSLHGQAKIAIGCMALRNRNGGYMVIGIDDTTLAPDESNRPSNVTELFHPDVIQQIVSQFASDLFEVKVLFAHRDGALFPVFAVEEGVRVPVAAKRELMDGKRHLIRQDAVYFRTLRSSGIVSSSAATHGDWRDILDICFENREADIGRFLRRHLGPDNAILSDLNKGDPQPAFRRRVEGVLAHGDVRRRLAFESPEFSEQAARYSSSGAWSVALAFDPPRQADDSDREFLRKMASANPQYTGWPVWLDSSGLDPENRPRKKEGAWESVILSDRKVWIDHAEFQWVHARGEFYLWRVYQDDLSEKVEPGTALDLGLLAYRFAEAIAVGLAFAKAYDVPPGTQLGFLFRAENLSGRQARTWANPERYIPVRGRAYDDEIQGYTVLDSDTPVNAIAPYLQQAMAPIAGAFDGSEISSSILEYYVGRLVSRTM
ncbi:AlbA family DNA-binding domain-containing protein [Rhizobium terrae]|uniref:AlbA family DNA-binding domain-containing protein n=1 Tax=Rhizobium terrae TaxID=2171756 RepID=UPI000E3D997B|nr:ATP-binding protein [Rhizobium terrae]